MCPCFAAAESGMEKYIFLLSSDTGQLVLQMQTTRSFVDAPDDLVMNSGLTGFTLLAASS
jgi:hypothetical protein